MIPEFYAILAVGVSLAGLILTGQRIVSNERQAIRQGLHAIAERVARLEGAFPFLAPRNIPPPDQAGATATGRVA